MTRKDYIAIATALSARFEVISDDIAVDSLPNGESYLAGFRDAMDAVAYALGQDNPRFDREHFLAVVRGERDLNSRPRRNAA